MESKRPLGVKICCVIAILHGLIQLYVYLNSTKLAGDFIMKPIYLCIAISYLLSGMFLLRTKNWARILFIW